MNIMSLASTAFSCTAGHHGDEDNFKDDVRPDMINFDWYAKKNGTREFNNALFY